MIDIKRKELLIDYFLLLLSLIFTVPFWVSISGKLALDTALAMNPWAELLLIFGNIAILFYSVLQFSQNKSKVGRAVMALSSLMLFLYLGLWIVVLVIFG